MQTPCRSSILSRGWRSCVVTLLGAGFAAGCGDSAPQPSERHRIRIEDEDGSRLQRYRAIVTSENGRIVRATCPDSPQQTVHCDPPGLSLDASENYRSLTIKAPGYVFRDFDLSTLELGSGGAVVAAVERLSPFESTETHRTGIDVAPGLDAFLALAVESTTAFGTAFSVKFFIQDFGADPTVYFQNTRLFPLHFDFANLILGVGQTRADFEQRTYHGEDRTQVAGTLVYYPSLSFPNDVAGTTLEAPLTLEFFPGDDLTAVQALGVHRLIEERLGWLEFDGSEHRLVYVPAGSGQEAALDDARVSYDRQDALFSDHVELFAGVEEQILNPGLAYGTLRLLTPEELETTVVSFRDLVVLPRLPNDLPLVGGTITEELQTPLAHVNLAARARGTPNIALRGASSDSRVEVLLDQLVRFEVTENGFSLEAATLEQAEAHWDSRVQEPLVPEADDSILGLPSFAELEFASSLYVGVKAANLGVLSQLLGEKAPDGFAVPFSAYDVYMSDNQVTADACAEARQDCEQEARTAMLCDYARERCDEAANAGDTFYGYLERLMDDESAATDTALREATVDSLRYLVRHGRVAGDFGAALNGRVGSLFGEREVRLRSSTNAEDLPRFSGAGLYDSVSAFASGEQQAASRIRDVWASVFAFRAYEEREYWGIDHRAVRMGVAVNPAIDDEVANGVLITQNLAGGPPGFYVNVQYGEVEVANPQSGVVPEVFSIVDGPGGSVNVVRQRFSSLSPNVPLLTDAEVAALAAAAEQVQLHFAPLYQESVASLALDLEFKFRGPERALLIKQARPYFSSETQ